ncbi:unnamed protein product [Caenorhabditis angaria]|uniref:Uncharacterized protein n=1 Tax=Caenorhabditis angaria TaxID=860376 RepID=A0A9P1IKH6_9PELO|nr:unnamed protein product [Caenorhabditis angaria]
MEKIEDWMEFGTSDPWIIGYERYPNFEKHYFMNWSSTNSNLLYYTLRLECFVWIHQDRINFIIFVEF